MDTYEIKPVVVDFVPVFVSIKEMQDERKENEEEYDLTELIASNLLQVKNKKLISKPRRKKIILEEEQKEERGEEEKEEEKEEEEKEEQKEKGRKTKRPVKGVAILGPEVPLEIDHRPIVRFMPEKQPTYRIKLPSYFMNNREIFIERINAMFLPYREELAKSENITCENIGKSSGNISLLLHQQITRDYLNLYTPYRGLLLYHGLGSGKTCTSIAIAEGMKDNKKIIIITRNSSK